MLMAGVLNSEVEKFCPASYRGTPPGSKSGALFSLIPAIAQARIPYAAPSVTKIEKPS